MNGALGSTGTVRMAEIKRKCPTPECPAPVRDNTRVSAQAEVLVLCDRGCEVGFTEDEYDLWTLASDVVES